MTKLDNTIGGLEFFSEDYPELISAIDRSIQTKKSCFLLTPTTEILGDCIQDPDMMKVMEQGDIRIPDSTTIIWLARLLGKTIKKRITGIDALVKLGQSKQRRYKVYYLGSKPEILELAVNATQKVLPAFDVVGSHDGYFSRDQIDKVIDDINDSKADILFVGMGFPKQELFIYNNLKTLTVPIKITVGGSFDVISGTIKRAPKWMQSAGIEWVYRLIQEPSRIGRMAQIPGYLFQLYKKELSLRSK
jgi:N-acetylglucosaminyldiphosphoundecaprenol N-acetyl-beta-D-mannosaminyltransferase